MTDTATSSPTPPKPKITPRQPSAKTLARLLARYFQDNKIQGSISVSELMGKLKASIVSEEVGVSLDGWET